MTDDHQSGSDELHRAFVTNFALHQPRIHSYIRTLLPHAADADEVMQETSLVMWSKWPRFDQGGDFVRWACGIARFEVLKLYRQRRKQGGLVLSDDIVEAISHEYDRQQATHDARREALVECLKELDDEQRQLLAQRYGQKVTTRELAEQLGRPVRTLYKALDRARKRTLDCIRRRLAAEERSA